MKDEIPALETISAAIERLDGKKGILVYLNKKRVSKLKKRWHTIAGANYPAVMYYGKVIESYAMYKKNIVRKQKAGERKMELNRKRELIQLDRAISKNIPVYTTPTLDKKLERLAEEVCLLNLLE